MPYITDKQRNDYVPQLVNLTRILSKCTPDQLVGHLNFIFTYLLRNQVDLRGESYVLYDSLIGALECCKLELYRQRVAKYEDTKINENGDV